MAQLAKVIITAFAVLTISEAYPKDNPAWGLAPKPSGQVESPTWGPAARKPRAAVALNEQNIRKDSNLLPVYKAAQAVAKSTTKLEKTLYQDKPTEPNTKLTGDLGSMMGKLNADLAWARDMDYASYVRQLQNSMGLSLDYATKHSAHPTVTEALKNAVKTVQELSSLVTGLQSQSYYKGSSKVGEAIQLGL